MKSANGLRTLERARWMVAAAIAGLAGCSQSPHRASWSIRFSSTDLENRAAVIEARILEGGCENPATLYAVQIKSDQTTSDPPALPPSRYGFFARAKDKTCRWFASGCAEITLPTDAGTTVEVMLSATDELSACDPTYCNAGECTGTRCVPQAETCNTLDDDCDGNIDEDVHLDSDPSNCGTCANVCMLNGATDACVQGKCAVASCDQGRADCDGLPENGCEADLSNPTTCGTCTTMCTGQQLCAFSAGGTAGCVVQCPASAPTQCGQSCVDTTTNMSNCGGCGISCGSPAHAMPTCQKSTCGLSCDVNYADCDSNRANGCEVSLNNDVNHCGSCSTACVRAHAVPRCSARTCSIGSCDTDYGNCDGNDANGCETNVATSTAHCGACGRACGAGVSCVAGTCQGGLVVDSSYTHSCAVLPTGLIRCWGGNASGELGDTTMVDRSTPVDVQGVTGATKVATGLSHTCAIVASGAAKCWGSNAFGQLGDGTTTDNINPVTVSGIAGAVSIAAGEDFTCAALSTGEVKCWGRNSHGCLGDNTTATRTTPVNAQGISTAVQVVAGAHVGCARLSNGTVQCWGDNTNGALGDGTLNDRLVPVSVLGVDAVGVLNDAVSISLLHSHACAVRTNGTVACWGRNGFGRLGDGTLNTSTFPVAVKNLTQATDVSANRENTCAVVRSGAVFCWGRGYGGANGNNDTNDASAPVQVMNITDAVAVTGGTTFVCAATGSGKVYCWGINDVGQLGDTTNAQRLVPVLVSRLP